VKILQVNYSDIIGGAARAAYRIHHALRDSGADSRMLVNIATAGDWTVEGPKSESAKVLARARPMVEHLLTKRLKTSNSVLHSTGILPSRRHQQMNASDVDVIHLHWVNGEMMSIADIGKLNKPVVWTLHDMWAFCGAEHYTEEIRWRNGYTAKNRPVYESGFDLNRWTFARKQKHWRRPVNVVTPSRWLANCAKNSVLMRDWPISVIPNTIDTDAWKPINKVYARELLHLPPDVPLVLFGAMDGTRDPRKGFDLLQAALNHLRGSLPGLELLVFGQRAHEADVDIGFPVHYAGHLHDDVSLRLLYSAADALLIPSRQDNLPNTGVEALSCGTPVVAFNACGLPDIVSHQQTGYLAKAFDPVDLAKGIRWVLEDKVRLNKLMTQARQHAVDRFANKVVVKQYLEIYQKAVKGFEI